MKKFILSVALLIVGSLASSVIYPHTSQRTAPTSIDHTAWNEGQKAPSHETGLHALSSHSPTSGVSTDLAYPAISPANNGHANKVPIYHPGSANFNPPPTGFHGRGRSHIAPPPPRVPKSPRARGRNPLIDRTTGETFKQHSAGGSTNYGEDDIRGHGLGAAHRSSAIGMPRPLRVFSIPFALARTIRAAAVPVNKYEGEGGSQESHVGMHCGAPFCSAASRSMANPLRYPVWMLAKVCSLFGSRGAHAIGPADEEVAHVHGLVPREPSDNQQGSEQQTGHGHTSTASHEDSHPIPAVDGDRDHGLPSQYETSTINQQREHEDSTAEFDPQTAPASTTDLRSMPTPGRLNLGEKIGGYVPIERPSNSSAPYSRLIPFVSLFRGAMLPMKALGWPVTLNAAAAHADMSHLEGGCGNINGKHGMDPVDGGNARESWGLGSAIVNMWERMRH